MKLLLGRALSDFLTIFVYRGSIHLAVVILKLYLP